jgi:hypothetical protein
MIREPDRWTLGLGWFERETAICFLTGKSLIDFVFRLYLRS